MRHLIALLALTVVNLFPRFCCFADQDPHELYFAGKVPEARAAFLAKLSDAEKSQNPVLLWDALMGVAWFEDETGAAHASIEHSNRALEIASTMKEPFRIGRSLCWLGWAYSSLGLYDLSSQFYREAVVIGAPEGNVVIVPVWGLATQELGAIAFKTGDIKTAKELLLKTTDYARQSGISVGVAEGGVHLAEIALVEGELAAAERYANEAVKAAIDCNCSQFNTARAKVTVARVALESAKSAPENRTKALALIEDALQFAERSGNTRPFAEAKLLQSRATPLEETGKRYELVRSAFEILESSESELRGTAESQLGRVLAEQDQLKLAEFYLKHGYKVNRELFRKLDAAYVLGDIADLHELKGDLRKALKKREAAAKEAEARGMLPLALDQQEKLAFDLEQQRYISLALQWAERALDTAERLLESQRAVDVNSPSSRALSERRLALLEQVTRLTLLLSRDHETPRPES